MIIKILDYDTYITTICEFYAVWVKSMFLKHSITWTWQDIKLLVALGWQVWERMSVYFLFVPNDIRSNWTSLNKKRVGFIGVEQASKSHRQIAASDTIRASLPWHSAFTSPALTSLSDGSETVLPVIWKIILDLSSPRCNSTLQQNRWNYFIWILFFSQMHFFNSWLGEVLNKHFSQSVSYKFVILLFCEKQKGKSHLSRYFFQLHEKTEDF